MNPFVFLKKHNHVARIVYKSTTGECDIYFVHLPWDPMSVDEFKDSDFKNDFKSLNKWAFKNKETWDLRVTGLYDNL